MNQYLRPWLERKISFLLICSLGTSLVAWASPSVKNPSKVIVAVIDTGIDPNHKALTQDIWRDPTSLEAPVYGWNFVTNRPNPKDENGHGTHIAGIIHSVSSPKTSISNPMLSPRVLIMPLKYYAQGAIGSINLQHSVKALYYAIEHGAKIIN